MAALHTVKYKEYTINIWETTAQILPLGVFIDFHNSRREDSLGKLKQFIDAIESHTADKIKNNFKDIFKI